MQFCITPPEKHERKNYVSGQFSLKKNTGSIKCYKKDYKCMWMFICTSFGSESAILFKFNSGNKLGVKKKKARAVMNLAVQQRNHFSCCGTNRLRLWLTASTSSPSVTHKRGSSWQRDVRTIASIYPGQERVDEELHVLPLNYHAPTASGHNGP